MTAAIFGHIGNFNEGEEDFESYKSRVDLYFVANDVDQTKQVPVFLTLIGAKMYTLTKNLLSPKEPKSATYKEITDALLKHFKPKRIVIYERYKFYSRNQKSTESISEYVAGIRALASTCAFKDNLNDMLRDRFVMGIANSQTQQYLLTESELTFDRAVEIATAREAALRDLQAAHNLGFAQNANINKISNPNIKSKTGKSNPSSNSNSSNVNRNANSNSNKPKNPCSGCGGSHWKRDCPYKDAECFNCNNKGHIKKVCRIKNPKSNSTNRIESDNESNNASLLSSYDYVFSIDDTKVPPIVLDMNINDSRLKMELDTGAARSLISNDIYKSLWTNIEDRPKLMESPTNLHAYGGVPLKVLGEIEAKVGIVGRKNATQCKLVVIDGSGPCLIGRDLISTLNISKIECSQINRVSANKFANEFPKLFSPGLGTYVGRQFRIEVDPQVPPRYFKARPVPFTMRAKVDEELDRLVSEGTITPITYSPWAAPIVPVLKSDNSIRICGDYKLTANKAARLDTYPIPRIEDLFSSLAGGRLFSKLDMSQAYAQLCLDDESKPYTIINTQKGLFQYNRLCFGISSAPGIFQRAMEDLLRDQEGVSCYLDDILISGSSPEEHDRRLRNVLNCLQSAGLRLKLDKCQFGLKEVQYLGFRIDGEGIHPSESKVEAIVKAPEPKDVSQLRAYLGLLNFYRKFIPKASTLLEPLNKLLRSKVAWHWDSEQKDAFEASKKVLLNSNLLVHFDPTKPLVLVADSSSYGVGAVLCHLIDGVERPICFASRTLTPTERNYSQLEKEALAIIYALRQFHFYLWGQNNFTLVTDHKPLLGLFGQTKLISPMSSGRIQRWSLMLQAYKFTLVHRSGALLGTADALSRLPLKATTDATPVPADWTNLINFLDWAPVTGLHISQHTNRDPVLSKILKFCENGWPSSAMGDPGLSPYIRRKDELSIQNGCVLWGSRVVIPPKLRAALLDELHSGHVGSSRMKELARSYLWWPQLDADLEGVTNSCSTCLENRASPPKAMLHPWEWPDRPWHRLHIDHAGPVNGQTFLIIVDAHSKWVEIFPTKGTTSKESIGCLQHIFSTFGLPVSIVSDNGPGFVSAEFEDFMQKCGIRHIKTAVYKPSTNGLAERMVQTFKRALKASSEPLKLTIERFLFNYRMTPHATTGVSPAELMFGRKLRSRLDLLWPMEQVPSRVASKQESQKELYTKKPRQTLFPSESSVMIRNYASGPKWIPGNIEEPTGPISYRCISSDGTILKRHLDQLTPRASNVTPPRTSVGGAINPRSTAETLPTPPSMVELPVEQPAEELVHVPEQVHSPALPIRRSSRIRKPVEKLNL